MPGESAWPTSYDYNWCENTAQGQTKKLCINNFYCHLRPNLQRQKNTNKPPAALNISKLKKNFCCAKINSAAAHIKLLTSFDGGVEGISIKSPGVG